MLKAVVLNRIARPVNFLPAPAPAPIKRVGFELFITHFKQHPNVETKEENSVQKFFFFN